MLLDKQSSCESDMSAIFDFSKECVMLKWK